MAREPASGHTLDTDQLSTAANFFEAGYKLAVRAARVEGGRRLRKPAPPPADRGETHRVPAPHTAVTYLP